MKQLAFMMLMLALGGVGAFVHPFWGVLLYYTFAVLRPQHLWEWALPAEMRWSLLAAGIAAVGVVVNLPKVVTKARGNAIVSLILLHSLFLLLSVLAAYNPIVAQEWGFEYLKIILVAVIASFVIDTF